MNIWVNGCFDILHSGHIDLLWYAKLYRVEGQAYPDSIMPNTLYVGVDTDDRVKMLKGDDRPINNVYDRLKIINNLRMVDSVVMFHDEEELEYFIKTFKIDYLVIGNDYKNKFIIGAKHAKLGVIYYPKDGKSSTNIIEKIKQL